MPIKGIGITLEYMAYNPISGLYVTGDAANHTLRWVKDGVAAAPTNIPPVEVDAANCPGLYKVTLTATEMTCDSYWLGGKSSTTNVILLPVSGTTEHGVLPTVPIGSNGALMTSGTNTGPWVVTNAAGDAVTFQSTGASGRGFVLLGNGASAGMRVLGGVNGMGLQISGGVTSGVGLSVSATSGAGFAIAGGGAGSGITVTGGATGAGLTIAGGSTSGDAVDLTWTSGFGMLINGPGTGLYCNVTGSGNFAARFTSQAGGVIIQGGSTFNGTGLQIFGAGTGTGAIIASSGASGGVGLNINAASGISAGLAITGGTGGGDAIVATSASGTGFTINAAGSGLQTNFLPIFRTATCQAGSTASTVVLDANASAVTAYMDCMVMIRSGTGAGQIRSIQIYNGATKTATIFPNWNTIPDATSVFSIISMSQVDVGNWLNQTIPVPVVTGVPQVDVRQWEGVSIHNQIAGRGWPDTLRYVGALVGGVITTAGQPVEKFLDWGGTDAVDVTVDSNGNRTAVALN